MPLSTGRHIQTILPTFNGHSKTSKHCYSLYHHDASGGTILDSLWMSLIDGCIHCLRHISAGLQWKTWHNKRHDKHIQMDNMYSVMYWIYICTHLCHRKLPHYSTRVYSVHSSARAHIRPQCHATSHMYSSSPKPVHNAPWQKCLAPFLPRWFHDLGWTKTCWGYYWQGQAFERRIIRDPLPIIVDEPLS